MLPHIHREFTSGPIHFMGGVAKGPVEIGQFIHAFTTFQCEQGVLMTPKFVSFPEVAGSQPHAHCVVDSAFYGDIIAASWNLYAFGQFDLDQCKNLLQSQTPASFAQRYSSMHLEAAEDLPGFLHILDSDESMGKEIRVVNSDGNWGLSRQSMFRPTTAKATRNHGVHWPLLQTTNTIPSVGERISCLGGLDFSLPSL